MALYSFNGAYPTQLPNKITLSDGTTRTDKAAFTAEEILDAGWIEVANPPSASYPNVLEWVNGTWNVRPPNTSETLMKIQQLRDLSLDKLNQTDYRVIKAYETGVALDAHWVTYRQELRDFYNSIPSDPDPWNATLPTVNIVGQDEI